MPWAKNFVANLKATMKHRKLTGQDLARASGVHWTTISRILNEANAPSVDTCEKLAKAAGINSPKIFYESDN